MNLVTDIILKFPDFISAGVNETESLLDFDKFTKAKNIKLRSHYDMWKQRICEAAKNNAILSNGWAFATMSGMAYFETFIRNNADVNQIYFNKSGEIARTVEAISEKLNSHKLNGAMIYGYGNLLRESYFIEEACKIKLINTERIYLLDCSLFYHIFAQSPLNPLRQTVTRDKSIRPILLDYCESEKCRGRLKNIRNDLNPFRSVLHLFLGNTFCNIDSATIYRILDSTVQSGDFVVAEYSNYTNDEFQSAAPDYVNVMATRAASELFAVPEDKIKADNIILTQDSKAVQINLLNDGQALTFRSMLRRKFVRTELTDKDFALVSNHQDIRNKLNIDLYQRMHSKNNE